MDKTDIVGGYMKFLLERPCGIVLGMRAVAEILRPLPRYSGISWTPASTPGRVSMVSKNVEGLDSIDRPVRLTTPQRMISGR